MDTPVQVGEVLSKSKIQSIEKKWKLEYMKNFNSWKKAFFFHCNSLQTYKQVVRLVIIVVV